jgi:hypothetical protein
VNPSERRPYQKLSYVERATRFLANTGQEWSSFKVSHFTDELRECVAEELANERRIRKNDRWELRLFVLLMLIVFAVSRYFK